MIHLAFIVSKQSAVNALRITTLCPSRRSLFLLAVTKITVFAASALLLIPASSASALTLGSRVVAGQDAGSIASLTDNIALDVFRSDWVSSQLDVGQSLVVVEGGLVPT